jgi:uncharacterized protein YbjT (DUF2867 family)
MYVITGATGQTGRPIVEKLLAQGKQVRAIARSAEHLKPLAAKGAGLRPLFWRPPALTDLSGK